MTTSATAVTTHNSRWGLIEGKNGSSAATDASSGAFVRVFANESSPSCDDAERPEIESEGENHRWQCKKGNRQRRDRLPAASYQCW